MAATEGAEAAAGAKEATAAAPATAENVQPESRGDTPVGSGHTMDELEVFFDEVEAATADAEPAEAAPAAADAHTTGLWIGLWCPLLSFSTYCEYGVHNEVNPIMELIMDSLTNG